MATASRTANPARRPSQAPIAPIILASPAPRIRGKQDEVGQQEHEEAGERIAQSDPPSEETRKKQAVIASGALSLFGIFHTRRSITAAASEAPRATPTGPYWAQDMLRMQSTQNLRIADEQAIT